MKSLMTNHFTLSVLKPAALILQNLAAKEQQWRISNYLLVATMSISIAVWLEEITGGTKVILRHSAIGMLYLSV
jgi:hypothetical protein